MPAIVNMPANRQKIKKILLTPAGYLVVSLLVVLFIVPVILVVVFGLILKAISKLYSLAGIKILPQWLGKIIGEDGVDQQHLGPVTERERIILQCLRQIVDNRGVERVPQTTHDTDVNYAVNFNVQKLRENYGEPDAEDELIEKIEDFINQMECVADDAQKDINKYQLTKSEKKHALDCLQHIKNNPDPHSGSELTLKQLLTLVWKACNDRDKKSVDPSIDIDTRILQRKYQLVKQLIESQTEYRVHNDSSVNACFIGIFNSIISSLYGFEEFSFLQKLDKDTIREVFKNELKKRGGNLFNQLSNDDDKKAVATALSNVSVTNFFLKYIEISNKHSARAVLGGKECDELITTYLNNLQSLETISLFIS